MTVAADAKITVVAALVLAIVGGLLSSLFSSASAITTTAIASAN